MFYDQSKQDCSLHALVQKTETVSEFPVGEDQDGVTNIHFNDFILSPSLT